MNETGYFERLKQDGPLFKHPTFSEEATTHEDKVWLRFHTVLNSRTNLPNDDRDEAILGIIKRLRVVPHIAAVLKNFGSPALKVDYYDPILEKQVQRGSLTQTQADETREGIRQGKINLFFWDFGMGMFTHYPLEKIFTLPLVEPVLQAVGYQGPIEPAIGYYLLANISAIPYFAARSPFELRYLFQKVKADRKSSLLGKAVKLSVGTAAIVGSVVSNAFPGISIVATPLLTINRYTVFSGTVLRHNFDNSKEVVQNVCRFIKFFEPELVEK